MIARHTTLFLTCCWVIVIGVCSWLLYMAFRPRPAESQVFVCGNVPMNNSGDSTFADGKAIFQSNCASCHNPIRDATGPALADIQSFRTPEWICRFLTKPKFIPRDERAINLRKQYSVTCMKFPQLNCKDVAAAVRYLDYRKR